jgi:hypothetical protein
MPNVAAQTRIVSAAGFRPDSRKSIELSTGIICDDSLISVGQVKLSPKLMDVSRERSRAPSFEADWRGVQHGPEQFGESAPGPAGLQEGPGAMPTTTAVLTE